MIWRMLIVILFLAAVLGGIFGWKAYQAQQAAGAQQGQPPATVAVTEARTERWQGYLSAVGSLAASQGVFVTSEVPGQVEAIRFESGQPVDKGEVLLELDDSVDLAELEGLKAERRLAEVQFRRTEQLLEERSVSRSEYDEAAARLESADAQLASKRAVIRKKTIRAPFSGQLGIRQVDLGEYLAPGARIVPLQALEPIYLDYTVPEREFARLAPGREVIVRVAAYPDEEFRGRITAINPGLEQETRTVQVRATLDNAERRLRPGMFAQVRTVLGDPDEVLTLPRTAVIYNPYGDSVFVVQEEDGQKTVQLRQIRTGEARDGRVAVVEGLEAGDTVVSAGQVKLRNGQAIEVDNSVELDPEDALQ